MSIVLAGDEGMWCLLGMGSVEHAGDWDVVLAWDGDVVLAGNGDVVLSGYEGV